MAGVGRTSPMIGASSPRGEGAGFPNTTDVEEMVEWMRPLDKVTVLATYASLELGMLERAHAAGLPGWSLIIMDGQTAGTSAGRCA
ncbi:hypothetical protein [Streptomyces sp. NPDC002526]